MERRVGANPFGWTILGVSRVISYSWRIGWLLNNRNHTTSLQDHKVGGRWDAMDGIQMDRASKGVSSAIRPKGIPSVSWFESKPCEWNILESKPGGRG